MCLLCLNTGHRTLVGGHFAALSFVFEYLEVSGTGVLAASDRVRVHNGFHSPLPSVNQSDTILNLNVGETTLRFVPAGGAGSCDAERRAYTGRHLQVDDRPAHAVACPHTIFYEGRLNISHTS